jgi:hypothetical protein
MFPFPSGERVAEGSSDDNPIVLVGDSVVEFRNFLWALYALYVVSIRLTFIVARLSERSLRPHELAVVHTPMADLTKLIDITRISNNNCFKSIETWALDAIQEYINQKPSPVLGMLPSPPRYTFVPIPGTPPTIPERLAQLCNHERLLTTMVGILRRMMTLNLTYAYLAMTLRAASSSEEDASEEVIVVEQRSRGKDWIALEHL